jgi:hypothetical protein
MTLAKSPDSFGLLVGHRAGHHLAGRAVDRDDVSLWVKVLPPT